MIATIPTRADPRSLEAMPETTPPDLPDPADDLVPRFLRGDREAIRCVIGWADRALRYDAGWIRPGDRADVVQDTLVGLWSALRTPGFALTTSLQALVRTITVARAIDWSRKRRPETSLPEDASAPSAGSDARLLAEARQRILQAALARVREACREILGLYYVDRLNYAQIARRLGRAEATLRVRMFHCLAELREYVGDVPRRS
jgi:RNA polymerase sigma factor (sigma-70 family)